MRIKDLELSSISTKQTADVLGLGTRVMSDLNRKGVLSQIKKGRYDLPAAVQSYIVYVKNAQTATPMQEAALSLREEQAKTRKIDNDKALGLLLSVEDVQHVLNETMVIITGMLSGMGGRLSGVLANIDDPGEIRKLILDETKAIRSTAADKLSCMGAIDSSSGDTEAATKPKSRPVGRRKKNTTKKRG